MYRKNKYSLTTVEFVGNVIINHQPGLGREENKVRADTAPNFRELF